PARPRPGLRRTVSAPSEGHADPGSPHGPAEPVAESLRGAAHRLDPARVSESRSGSRRKPPAPHPDPLLLLLSPGSHASRARQGCAGRQARRAPRGGQDRGDSRSRWPASPLPPPGGVVQHRLTTYFPVRIGPTPARVCEDCLSGILSECTVIR